MRFFFATDIHGSETCFRKFLRASEFYGVDALFLGGDYTSKSLIACVRSNGGWRTRLGTDVLEMRTLSDFLQFKADSINRGNLVIELAPDDFEIFRENTEVQQQLFDQAQREQLKRWAAMAADQLTGKGIKIYHIPGNDEPLYCDQFFNEFPFVPVDRRHIKIDENLACLGFGGSNRTPWKTHREYEEIEIEELIGASFCEQLKDIPLIFVGHVPPFKSGLDSAPELRSDLSYRLALGCPARVPTGSIAVREAIQRLQPVVALFGHVHESRGQVRIGKTICVNPGSGYHACRLQGCVVTIRNDRVSIQFTEG